MSYLEYLRGPIEARGPNWVVIDAGGIGYRATVTPSTAESLPPSGEVKLWTYLYVREDIRGLYAFQSIEERGVFEQLLGVGGVGPRMAMAALAMLGVGRLAAAIEASDEAALAKVPGVGKKTASRIILDLRGKLTVEGDGVGGSDGAVLEALITFGLKREEAAAVLRSLPPDPARTPEETVALAFRTLGGGRGR